MKLHFLSTLKGVLSYLIESINSGENCPPGVQLPNSLYNTREGLILNLDREVVNFHNIFQIFWMYCSPVQTKQRVRPSTSNP